MLPNPRGGRVGWGGGDRWEQKDQVPATGLKRLSISYTHMKSTDFTTVWKEK